MKIIITLFFLAHSLSFADPTPSPKPCTEDLIKFCKDMHKKEAKKCLKAHLKEISPACKKHLEEIKTSNASKKEHANHDQEEKVSEECKNVKATDANFKECAKERFQIAKNKFQAYREKLKANKKARLDKEREQKEKEQKEKLKTE